MIYLSGVFLSKHCWWICLLNCQGFIQLSSGIIKYYFTSTAKQLLLTRAIRDLTALSPTINWCLCWHEIPVNTLHKVQHKTIKWWRHHRPPASPQHHSLTWQTYLGSQWGAEECVWQRSCNRVLDWCLWYNGSYIYSI